MKARKLKLSVALAAFIGCLANCASIAAAGEILRQGEKIIVRGNIEVDDLRQVEFEKTKKIVFENSLGGTYAAAIYYIQLIREHELSTIVKGKCFSACALAFLAGHERTVESNWSTVAAISFHSGRVIENGSARPYDKNERLISLLTELTRGKMKKNILEMIKNSWSESSGVIFVVYPSFIFSRTRTLYCDGRQGFDTSKCESLSDADPVDMGVLTSLP
jgi:hypothetical protein